MSEWSAAGARPTPRNTIEVTSGNKPRLIFLASQQAIYQCLFHAAQRYFSVFEVNHFDQLPAGEAPDDTVRLVLLGQGQGWITPNNVIECRRRFPAAAIGLMVEQGGQNVDPFLVEQRLVQGVLPMTLPLDVWLAVASLLVAGGEYLLHDGAGIASHIAMPRRSAAQEAVSAGTTRPEIGIAATESTHRMAGRSSHGGDHTTILGMASLTARERQILQLVSEGYQNKLIADRMALSEHTVKAHVHNLIAKLRVTNRTQAAAFFHEHEFGQAPHGEERADARLVALHGR